VPEDTPRRSYRRRRWPALSAGLVVVTVLVAFLTSLIGDLVGSYVSGLLSWLVLGASALAYIAATAVRRRSAREAHDPDRPQGFRDPELRLLIADAARARRVVRAVLERREAS
jgi:hypothetical protein